MSTVETMREKQLLVRLNAEEFARAEAVARYYGVSAANAVRLLIKEKYDGLESAPWSQDQIDHAVLALPDKDVRRLKGLLEKLTTQDAESDALSAEVATLIDAGRLRGGKQTRAVKRTSAQQGELLKAHGLPNQPKAAPSKTKTKTKR